MDTGVRIRIRILRKETHRMTKNKMVQPGTTRHQDEREESTRNQKGKTVGREMRLETVHPSICTKWK
jgi:hypothetical protein